MKHIGIIAEYNPFHNGHQYQLQKARELFPDKKIIILMSGNYVQRGEPAIYNKYLRTQCALSSYADIIMELPLLFSCASAEHFAQASIQAFQKLGVIDTLCFGAETDNLPLLQEIAHLLVTEPDAYRTHLQQELKKGNSFPKARMLAITTILQQPEIAEILSQPNNILAIEYLKAIENYNADITPIIIKRKGKHYHDPLMNSEFSSATSIRKALKANSEPHSQAIPQRTFDIIKASPTAKPLFASDFYEMLQFAMWKEYNSFNHFQDITQDLSNQIQALRNYPQTWEELIYTLSSKQYTTTRIQRILLNILLGITKNEISDCKAMGYISYLRLLGFKKEASTILKEIKEQNTIPIINKVADAKNYLSENDLTKFENELHRTHLYNQVFYKKYGIQLPSEYEHSVIISE